MLAQVNLEGLGKGLLIVLFLIFSTLLILTVLIQKPQGGGLAGAFGSGAGSGQTAFGAKTGDALTWATIIMFVVWLFASVGLNLAFRPADAITDEAEAVSTETPLPAETTGDEAPAATPDGPAALPAGSPPAETPPASPPSSPDPAEPGPAPQTPPAEPPAEPPAPSSDPE